MDTAAPTAPRHEAGAPLSEAVAKWIEERRKIPVEIAASCGLCTVQGWPAYEYRTSRGLHYRKLRISDPNTGEKSFRRDRSGTETCLFGEHEIELDPDLSSPLVICEGENDRLALKAAGLPNVVSVPDGAQLAELGEGKIDPLNDKAFGWLWDGPALKKHIAQFERFVLFVDADKKGRVLREELAVRLDRTKCWAVLDQTMPEGCKDANDVLIKFGTDEGCQILSRLVAGAVPIVPDRLVPLDQIVDLGSGEIFPSGFQLLDDRLHFAFYPPELVVITGAPGSGKSEFATIMGANLAHHSRLPGAILQFEDRTTRVRETLVRYALQHVQGCTLRSDALGWAGRWFRTIEPQASLDNLEDYNLAWLTETLREARTRHGCRWVILDPWNELDHMWDRSQNEAQYINDALRKIKRIGRALNMIIMIVVHPSKEGGRQKEITEMDLYGIAGAAAWANKADHGFIIHRPDHSKSTTFVKLAKSKDHATMGTPGIITMEYIPSQGKYRQVRVGV